MDNLIILGNGFDLAHGLKTSYNNFLRYIVTSYFKDPYIHKDLIKIESKLVYNYDTFINYFRNNYANFLGQVKFENKFFKVLLENYSISNWCDIEHIYFVELYSLFGGENKNFSNVKELNDDFEVIKKKLSDYLLEETQSDVNLIDGFTFLFDKINTESTVVLNFNYTNTLTKYFSNKIYNVINIHGEIENIDNPIIFGYAADNKESRALIDSENEFLKNIKKHNYKRTNNDRRLKELLNINKKNGFQVSVFGHSCGISDKLILQEIFNHENVKRIKIFPYENYESFFQTAVNIDRIMGNDAFFNERLEGYNEKLLFPQINHKDDQKKGFVIEIEKMIKRQEESKENNKIIAF